MNPGPSEPVPDGVAAYLDTLRRLLTGSSEHIGRVLMESEAHLLDATAAHRAAGVPEEAAVRAALGEFGRPEQVAAAINRAGRVRARGGVLRAGSGVVVRLAATAMVLAGMTAVTSRLLVAATSVQAVFGLPVGARVPAGACAVWLAGNPAATSCQQAGTWEAAGDLTLFGTATGALGVALWSATWWRRRGHIEPMLPPVLEPGIGIGLFVAVGAGAAALAASDAVVFTTWGAGMWWTLSGSALLIAVGFGIRMWAAMSVGYHGLPAGRP